jgi:hypothetical protein
MYSPLHVTRYRLSNGDPELNAEHRGIPDQSSCMS